MNDVLEKKLQWTQRVALVRHNLHMAVLSRDFGFFKALQAEQLIRGTDLVAILNEYYEDDDMAADAVVQQLDKFNSVIACVHEDAFKNVHTSVKSTLGDTTTSKESRRAMIHEDISRQRRIADQSIDKMFSIAIDLVKQQPETAQETAGDILILGTTFIADAIEVCIAHMDRLEQLDDISGLDDSWEVVEGAVGTAVSAMKGVFNLLAPSERRQGQGEGAQLRHSASVDNYAKSMFRRMSSVFTGGTPTSPLSSPSMSSMSSQGPLSRRDSTHSRKSSSASCNHPPLTTKRSWQSSHSYSDSIPPATKIAHAGPTTMLDTIPATPPVPSSKTSDEEDTPSQTKNPFEKTFTKNTTLFSRSADIDDEQS